MGTLALGSCGGAAHLHIDIARLNWQCFFTCAAQGIVQDAIAFDPHYYKDLYSNDIFFDSEIYIYIYSMIMEASESGTGTRWLHMHVFLPSPTCLNWMSVKVHDVHLSANGVCEVCNGVHLAFVCELCPEKFVQVFIVWRPTSNLANIT